MIKTHQPQRKIEELLSDSETYEEHTNGNEDEKVMKKLKKLTKEHQHELTKSETDYIKNFRKSTNQSKSRMPFKSKIQTMLHYHHLKI